MLDPDKNSGRQQFHDHLYSCGLSPEAIGDFDLEQSLQRLFQFDLTRNEVQRTQPLLDVLRNVRLFRRFDLLRLCESFEPATHEDRALTTEFVLLYLDAQDWLGLRRYLELRPEINVELPSRAILQMLPLNDDSNSKRITIWPNENVPYAAKTAIFNVTNSIINRQRSLIDALLRHIEGQCGL